MDDFHLFEKTNMLLNQRFTLKQFHPSGTLPVVYHFITVRKINVNVCRIQQI